jgi:hypothetical protein
MEAAAASSAGARIEQLFGSVLDNNRRLIDGGAKMMFGDDAAPWSPSVTGSLAWGKYYVKDMYMDLGKSHVYWFKAASEQGLNPMTALVAATRNVAEGYGKLDELGTIEPGKHADFVVLDADPLADPENYARVAHVVKEGVIVDRDALPEKPVLTSEVAGAEARVPAMASGGFPGGCCGRPDR